MALAAIADLYTVLGIATPTPLQTAQATLYVGAADAAVKSYLQRGRAKAAFANWPELCSDVEILDGTGTPSLVLTYTPVISLQTINWDTTAFGGSGPNAWAPNTLLINGVDYFLGVDDGQQVASGGIVVRIGGPGSGGSAGDYGWFPGGGAGGWGGGPYVGGYGGGGTLAGGRSRPCWPLVSGSIRAAYTCGYATIPADLSMATLEYAAYLYRNARYGGNQELQSESLGIYTYNLAQVNLNNMPALGSIRQMLSPYRLTRAA